jgi:putative transposase
VSRNLSRVDRPVRKRLAHFIPHWLDERPFFFVTINCVPRGKNQLCLADVGPKILASADYYHQQMKWHAALFLLMPDHVHAIVSLSAAPGLKAVMRAWKSYQKRFHGIEWQDDFFDHRLRDRAQFEEKYSYILHNPVRKGLCARPEDWPYVFRPQSH